MNATTLAWYEKAAGKRKPRSATPNKDPHRRKRDRRQQTKALFSADVHDTDKQRMASPLPHRLPTDETVSRHHARHQLAKTRRTVSTESADRRTSQQSPTTAPLLRAPLFAANAVPPESRAILARFDALSARVCALNGRQQEQLAASIKRLSHALTDERASRRIGYMNDSSTVSAYISYFMWWNLERMTRLLANLPHSLLSFTDGDAVLDVGSGTLTVPIALWLARPDLRLRRLTIYCLDTSQNALAIGEELYLAIVAQTMAQTVDMGAASEESAVAPWRIVRIRGAFGDGVQLREKVALITCANVFNEITQTSTMPPDYLAKKYTHELLQYARDKSASVLLVEPGDPKSARFVALMRDALLRSEYAPVSPCPHSGSCPMSGRRTAADGTWSGKWCNFAFATDDAPHALRTLSERVGLSKTRAGLSFLLATHNTDTTQNHADRHGQKSSAPTTRIAARIASDVIVLPELHRVGYYACSERGLLLVLDGRHLHPQNGDLITVRAPHPDAARDGKSGALIVEL